MTSSRPVQAGPIILIGFMGSGKSSVGPVLARELGCDFIDLDSVVEHRAGKPISKIFAGQGEQSFRRLESEALDETLSHELGNCVLALGGGAYAQAGNRERIARSSGRVIFLEVALHEATRRVKKTGGVRPLAADRQHLETLFHERQPFYQQAHFRIDTTNKSVETVAKELAAWIRKQERR